MEIKKIARIGGKIGAVVLGIGGLILAGRSGFGETLKLGSGANETTDDLADMLAGDATVPEENTFEPDPAEEEETSE